MIEALRWLWEPEPLIAIQRPFGPEWRLVFETFSLLGGHQLVIFAVGWARWFHSRALTTRLVMAVLLGLAVDLLIWGFFPTPRPDDPRVWVATEIPISSFPSGHMVTCLTIWGTFATARLLSPAAVAAIVLLVGLGRLSLGQHYPGDVLGGMIIGLLILGFVAWAWPRLRAVARRLTRAQHLTVGFAVAILALAASLVVPPGRWEILGLIIGLALGFPAEESGVGFTPAPLPWRARLRKAAIGVAGIGVYVAVAAMLRDFQVLHNLLLPAALACWVVLGAPLIFHRLGWSEPREVAPGTAPLLTGMAQ